jgi:hypothetical protein
MQARCSTDGAPLLAWPAAQQAGLLHTHMCASRPAALQCWPHAHTGAAPHALQRTAPRQHPPEEALRGARVVACRHELAAHVRVHLAHLHAFDGAVARSLAEAAEVAAGQACGEGWVRRLYPSAGGGSRVSGGGGGRAKCAHWCMALIRGSMNECALELQACWGQ